MLIAAGGYLSYYWWRIKYGRTKTLSSDPIVGPASRFTAHAQRWAHQQGGLLLTVAAVIVTGAVIAWRTRRHPADKATVTTETMERTP